MKFLNALNWILFSTDVTLFIALLVDFPKYVRLSLVIEILTLIALYSLFSEEEPKQKDSRRNHHA